jgi:phosphoribosyl 1,2-cyclic phosphodiesterase
MSVDIPSLHVLGSGSRGNAFAVAAHGHVLLVDAGFSAAELERRAAQAGVALDRLAGIALTHEHGDHASGALRLARTHGVPILASPGTWRALGADARVRHVALSAATRAEIGPFTLLACPTSHDAAEPVAIGVELPDGPSVAFAYDLGRPTAAVRYLLRRRTVLVLESNHDEVRLRTSGYPPSVQQRIAGSGGHLSNRAAAELLADVHHDALAAVVLAHLSERCNSAEDALATVQPALRRAGFRGLLACAPQDAPLAPITIAPPAGAQFGLAL